MADNLGFTDRQNVNLRIRALGWKLDWRRFGVHLKETYEVTTAYIFIGLRRNKHRPIQQLAAGRLVVVFLKGSPS